MLLFSRQVMSDSWGHHGLQHSRLPCPPLSPGVCLDSCLLSWWCHPTVSSSVIPLYSHLQSFPVSGSFQMSQLFTSGGQNIGVSASASVFPMNIQDWSPLGWTDWISVLSMGLSRVFSNTTVQKHHFFGAQKNGIDDCICKAEIVGKKSTYGRQAGRGEVNREAGTDTYTVSIPCVT